MTVPLIRFSFLWISLALLLLSPALRAQPTVEALEQDLRQTEGISRIAPLVELGELVLQSDPDRSLSLGEEALALAEDSQDPALVARALFLLGLATSSLGRLEDSVRYYQRGVEIAESYRLTRELIRLLSRLGSVYAVTGSTERGLELSIRALKLVESSGDEVGRSEVLGEVGVVYMLRGEWEEARRWMTEALEAKRIVGDSGEVAGALSNLGVIHRNQGHFEDALAYQEAALAIEMDLGRTHSIASSQGRIARIHTALGDTEKAIEYHRKALSLRDEIGDRRGMLSSLRDLQELHRSRQEFETALEYYDRWVTLQGEVFNQESRQRIEELQARFRVERAERENAFLRQTNRLQLVGFIVFLVLATVAGYSLVWRYRQRTSAATLEYLRQQLRHTVLEMKAPGDWEKVISSLRAGLEHFVAGLCDCRVFQLDERKGREVELREIESGGEDGLVRRVPAEIRWVLESAQITVLDENQVAQLSWVPGFVEAAAVVAIPCSRTLILVTADRAVRFGPQGRRDLLELAKVTLAAVQRLNDLRVLAVRDAQLRQARRLESLGSLTAGVAHNFNNLLQVILGNLEMIRESNDGPRSRQLDDIGTAAGRASQLVNRLLLFSRHAAEVPTGKVDPGKLVAGVVFQMEEDIELADQLPGGITLDGNEAQLSEAVRQLISNACDAVCRQPVKEIKVLLETVGLQSNESPSGASFVRLRISDNGPGIPLEIQEQVFDPFFTTRRADREGLGLSIVIAHVERHGGWVDLDSKPGTGTSVSVYLPVATPSIG